MESLQTRRRFLSAAGCAAAGFVCAADAPTGGADLDPNLMVFFADVHLHDPTLRWKNGPTHQNAIFPGYVKEVLAMRPMPAHAVLFGDFSASRGHVEDFRLVAEALRPLAEAGVSLAFAMGNHDNRANFLSVFPEYRGRMLLRERIVSKVSTPNADLLMIDTLKTRPGQEWGEIQPEGNFSEGAVDERQREWLRDTLRAASRPTFVGGHHCTEECGIRSEIVSAPSVFGYIFGHRHQWETRFLHDGTNRNSQTVQTATLPSSGYYGDIGYATFRTLTDRAELVLHQDRFFFNRMWSAAAPRPKNWDERVRRNNGAKVVFWYDKPGNFWKSSV